MIYYIGDTHFGHENIIRFCARPFIKASDMDQVMADAIRRVDLPRNRIVHVGDFIFGIAAFYRRFGELQYPEHNVLVVGNHDRLTDNTDRRKVQTWFRTLIGERGTWRENYTILDDKLPSGPVRVLVSHLPQQNLRGCDYNVYGHFHNNLFRQAEREADWLWVLQDKRYLNAGVEITDYMPMTLAQLVQANEEAVDKVW